MACGFVPNDVPDAEQWWEDTPETSDPCPRDTKGEDRCFWHTRKKCKRAEDTQIAINEESNDTVDFAYLEEANLSDNDFKNINFRSANFAGVNFGQVDFGSANYTGSSFENSDLSNKDLYGSVFHNCNFERADLSESELELVQFEGSNLRRANLERIKCSQTNFADTNLEGAILTGSLLTDASFENARLQDAILENSKISSQTFDKECWYEEQEKWENATSVYRSLTTLCRENSISGLARTFYFKQKQCQRRDYRQKAGICSIERIQNLGAWVREEGARWISGYGDRPLRVIATWGTLILIWTYGYIKIRGVEYGGEPVPPTTRSNIIDYLYYSVSTFTPLGSNNFQPTSTLSQILSISEALFGALFVALLVYVLGRRITW